MLTDVYDQFVLFEDSIARSRRFLPLTYTRPVSLLRAGMFTALERLSLIAPKEKIVLHTSALLSEATRDREQILVNQVDPSKHTLLINARAFLNTTLIQALSRYEEDCALISADGLELFATCFHQLPAQLVEEINSGAPVAYAHQGKSISTPIKSFDSLWGMIHTNGQSIHEDVELAKSMGVLQNSFNGELSGVQAAKPGNVIVHTSAKIGLGTVLDATDGPIVIEEGVRIFPNSTIMGPCVIGRNSLVKIGAKIYEGTTIGPTCKVGGEIENSIVLSYSNKQHDGYLGHSYLGSWVNLGADTNTSDLKNDYSNVKVFPEDEEIDTGSMFVGLLMGDHSKSAINTQFNTGTVVGVSCNIFDSGFPPKWIPSFSWGGAAAMQPYRSDKAIDVARKVLKRRSVELLTSEEALLKSLSRDA
jgi:UDP-N-acetylglucosamine diphosphorylase / glucose-1-phosphate thymidylyltransferase / UDP-N-acetylgalactosamine diphosphorylase / glucosamine-1-phosphate N-acetyltransferase / galactosamine-1-phosphate N-acetyltransferase